MGFEGKEYSWDESRTWVERKSIIDRSLDWGAFTLEVL